MKDPCKERDPPEELCLAESQEQLRGGVLGAVCSITVASTGNKVRYTVLGAPTSPAHPHG